MSNLDYYTHKEQILQLEENFKPLKRNEDEAGRSFPRYKKFISNEMLNLR